MAGPYPPCTAIHDIHIVDVNSTVGSSLDKYNMFTRNNGDISVFDISPNLQLYFSAFSTIFNWKSLLDSSHLAA